ncbi:MAG: FAD-dependent oxidoreductase [Paracoccaceae bacterium]
MAADDARNFPHIFRPMRIGTLNLRNRIMAPPHGTIVADPLGTEAEAARYSAYWLERVRNGLCWVDGVNTFIDNRVVPRGYRPSGLGAILRGSARNPLYRDRIGRFADLVHQAGGVVTTQLINQGAMPHSASGILANHTNNQPTHALDPDELAYIVEDYAHTAKAAQACGLDGLELHANHEDVLQLFLSPYTNRREDDYGGTQEKRLKLLRDVLAAMRAEVGRDFTIGVRFNMDELFEGGYDLDEGIGIARAIEATGHIDFFHGVIGNNWGAPSYIQPHTYGLAEWAEMAGLYRAALSVPMLYTGRISTPEAAESVLARGLADVVGVARGFFADPAFVAKAERGEADRIIPCIGCNDCLHAVHVEKLPFGCAVNPRTGREAEPAASPARTPRRIVVVGGGPAGMEAAAVAAERGNQVILFEAEPALGGQMALAAAVPENAAYARYVAHQSHRLARAGVALRLGQPAGAETVLACAPDAVIVATGAGARGHAATGTEQPFVVEGREVLAGRAAFGSRVLVLAREDHMQPLTIASYLADKGAQVRILFQTPAVAPLVGKYSIGAIMSKLSNLGVEVRVMERAVDIAPGRVTTRNVYSGVEAFHDGFDTLVLACGGTPRDDLYHALKGKVGEVTLLGDAYVPGRIVGATRQGWEAGMRA